MKLHALLRSQQHVAIFQRLQMELIALLTRGGAIAVYKLGDMFGRGRAVPQDKSKAYRLYERSLELARNDVEFAQPAIRIAAMLIDPDAPSCGI